MPIQFPLISVNGIFDAAISPLDRGFAYGDGLFETCRYQQGLIPLWQYHRTRLLESAQRLLIPLDESVLQQYLQGLLVELQKAAIESAVVKIQITRGVGARGYRIAAAGTPTYCLSAFPAAQLQLDSYRNGVDVRICRHRLGANPALAGMKHLNRLEQILARAEWQDEYAEGLLMDESGAFIEATVSNLFLVKNNQFYTPDLSRAGVAGVMRRVIIDKLAPQLGALVNVVRVDRAFLLTADELFLCNSVYGIWPVNRLVDDLLAESQSYDFAQHRLTRQLQCQLEQLFTNIACD